jgi:hypothetical protein
MTDPACVAARTGEASGKVSAMAKVRASVTCHARRDATTLELTDDYLVHRWRRGRDHGEKRISLDKLCPHLSLTVGRPRDAKGRTLGGLVVIAFAFVFYFSAVQNKVPLLSLFIGMIGICLLARGLWDLRVETWTVIQDEGGKCFAHLMHLKCNDEKRKIFERAYEDVFRQRGETG